MRENIDRHGHGRGKRGEREKRQEGEEGREKGEREREEMKLTFLLQVIICSAPPIGTNECLNNPKQHQ